MPYPDVGEEDDLSPDWGIWRGLTLLTVLEAVALSMWLDPKFVTSARARGEIDELTSGEIFGKQVASRLKFVCRAVRVGPPDGLTAKYNAAELEVSERFVLEDALVTPSDFVSFCDRNSWAIPDELRANVAGKLDGKDPGASIARRWPWGEHETRLLSHLAEAAHQFWSTYDSDNPTTAPKSADVVRFLKAAPRNTPVRVAQVIAQILRADNLAPGPRKIK